MEGSLLLIYRLIREKGLQPTPKGNLFMSDCCARCCAGSTRREFLKAAGGTALVLWSGLAFASGRGASQVQGLNSNRPHRLTEEERNYYVNMKDKLMKKYDQATQVQREVLVKHFDETRVNAWLVEARKGYESLIPQLPYIGGDENDFTRYLTYPSGIMPLVKILRDEGVPIRKNGQMIYEISVGYYNAIPSLVKWFARFTYFGDSRKSRMQAAAQRSQLRRYPGDWVFEFVEGDGKSFQYGLDMTECGLVKFWNAQGLEEFTPYLCLTDYAFWRAIGIEATRTQTIANGASRCDFKYIRKGSNGQPGWPPESNPEWTGRYEP